MKFNPNSNLILQFLKQRKLKAFIIIFFGVLSNVLTILIPVSIGKYYELVFHVNARRVKSLSIISNRYWDTVPKFLIVFSLLVVFRFLFFFIYEYLLRKEAIIFIKEIKDYLFKHQLKVKHVVYKEKGIGKYLLRYSGDINSLKNLYIKGAIRIFIDGIMILIAISWLWILNEKGATAILLLSILFYLILRLINKKLEFYSLLKRNKTSGQLSFVSRSLNSILNIIILNKQEVELKKYKKKSNNIKNASIIYTKWFVINKGFISFIQYIILSVILYIFYIDSIENGRNGSNLISFILLYLTILPVIRRLFSLESVYKLGNISLRKLNNILHLDEENISKGRTLSVKNPSIIFENVIFKNSNPINFIAKKNERNILFLPKGVGSLDLIYAILKIYDNYSGTIKINKESIKQFSSKSLRDQIAIASQNIPISGRTVYEAITKYRSKIIKKETLDLFESIRSPFSENIKLKLDDNIGENGSKLSKIQKEFLSLVRGVIQKKRIIIVSEFPLLKAINEIELFNILEKQKATVIIIKH